MKVTKHLAFLLYFGLPTCLLELSIESGQKKLEFWQQKTLNFCHCEKKNKAHKCQTSDHLNRQFDWPITPKTFDSARGIIGIEPTLALAFYFFLMFSYGF